MDYLKPVETLEKSVSTYKKIILALIALLGMAIALGPALAKNSNPVLIPTEGGIGLATTEPWKLSTLRTELFLKAYLRDRFEWDETTIDARKKELSVLTGPAVLARLKDSEAAFEALARNQKAKSYYVLEGFGFSLAQSAIEAHVTRVLRLQDAALATPLVIRLGFTDAALSPGNPYALQVSLVEESELGSGGASPSKDRQ